MGDQIPTTEIHMKKLEQQTLLRSLKSYRRLVGVVAGAIAAGLDERGIPRGSGRQVVCGASDAST